MHAIQVSQATPSIYTVLSEVQTLQAAIAQAEVTDQNGIIIIRPAVNIPNSTIGRLIKVTVIVCTYLVWRSRPSQED